MAVATWGRRRGLQDLCQRARQQIRGKTTHLQSPRYPGAAAASAEARPQEAGADGGTCTGVRAEASADVVCDSGLATCGAMLDEPAL